MSTSFSVHDSDYARAIEILAEDEGLIEWGSSP